MAETFTALDPRTGDEHGEPFAATPSEQVDAVVARAVEAHEATAGWTHERFAAVLAAIAEAIDEDGLAIVETADAETALGRPRLEGELARTTAQLRAFAEVAASGEHLEAIVDPAVPDRRPPRPDLRRLLVPLGPVAVFGASNFPLAFGVAGGDTASALAAGCPVVAKGHPAHPATSARVGRRIGAALAAAGAPAGLFAQVQGPSPSLGQALVTASGVAAVGFTGSLRAGRALCDFAAARARPIPVYAEMGSVNPLIVTDAALAERAAQIAEGLASSLLTSAGQLCTSPGIVFVPRGPGGDGFIDRLLAAIDEMPDLPLLTSQVRDGAAAAVASWRTVDGVALLHEAPDGIAGIGHPAVVLATDATTLARERRLREEAFGPVSLVVRYETEADLLRAIETIDGALVAALHVGAGEPKRLGRVRDALERRVGRIVWNDYPTGVAVTAAMQHGGPYPATSNPLHTSVGTTAVRRFQRPIAFQGAPQEALPPALRDGNPLRIPRRVDGSWTRGPAPA